MAKSRINLIPTELQIASYINKGKLLVIWVILVMTGLLIMYVFQKACVLRYQSQIARQNIEAQLLEEQKEDLNKEIAEFEGKLRNRAEVENMAQMIKKILSDYTFPSTLLKELSFLIPPEIWVTQLSLTPLTEEAKDKATILPSKLLTIEGIALNEEALAVLLMNLESHPWFKKMKLNSAERDEDEYPEEVFTFSLEGRLEEKRDED